ncbi:MAG: hypothetical protein FJ278_00415 [Planctomycetes bacterium]|nr:hypothetical protein [Planctomycetota bacterium]
MAIDTASEPKLLTPGLIADRLGVPVRRIQYVLTNCRGIRPAARAGILRLYDNEAVRRIQAEIDRISRRRRASHD